MRSRDLVLRCFAERSEGLWQAICLDLDLAAQGTTLEDVQRRLAGQIAEYVADALVGEDQQYAAPLLRRRAPLIYWIKYGLCRMRGKMAAAYEQALDRCAFYETLPLAPAKT